MPVFRVDHMEGSSHRRLEIRRPRTPARCFREVLDVVWGDHRVNMTQWRHIPEVPNGQTLASRAYRYGSEFNYYLVVKIED